MSDEVLAEFNNPHILPSNTDGFQPCYIPGCINEGLECYYDDDSTIYFCEEHLKKNHFCWCCCKHLTEEEQKHGSGLCKNCKIDNYDETFIVKVQVSLVGPSSTLVYNEDLSIYHKFRRSMGRKLLGRKRVKGYFYAHMRDTIIVIDKEAKEQDW